MKKSQLDHILRAAKEITGESKFIVIGSQSLHGKGVDVDSMRMSNEADIYIQGREAATELLNAIGEGSQFHETFGYYADPVDSSTAKLPKNWKNRLVNLPPGDTNGAKGLCLDPHDLAISKLVAGREKDFILLKQLARRGVLDMATLAERLTETDIDERMRAILQRRINGLFRSQRKS